MSIVTVETDSILQGRKEGEGQGQCKLALVRFLDEPLVHHLLGVLVSEDYLSAYVFYYLISVGM